MLILQWLDKFTFPPEVQNGFFFQYPNQQKLIFVFLMIAIQLG
jgi:hypothetical protein